MSGLVAGAAVGAEDGAAVFGAEWLQARVASRAAAIGVVRGTKVSGMGRGGGNLARSYDMGNGRVSRDVECWSRLFDCSAGLLDPSARLLECSARPLGCSARPLGCSVRPL